ncbi:MAG: hypothetical protein E7044_08570 [Lentisphaerae bacterium]|nr:hypothetical protein [Lentisphaerota bacterium]
MLKTMNFLTVFLMAVNLSGRTSLDDGLIFHFDFSKAAAKKTVADSTGKFKCFSDKHTFALQNKGLRIAPDADFTIPMPQKMNGKKMSFSLWLVTDGKKSNVIFFKGLHPYTIEYALMLDRKLPMFCYKNKPGQDFWKGVFCVKHAFPQKSWLIPGVSPEIKPEYWNHLVYTFDRGSIRIYINGVLSVHLKSKAKETLKVNTYPGLVGADKVYGGKSNYSTADLLVNGLRLYDRVLQDSEVRELYKKERSFYTQKKVPLQECLAYLDPSVRAFDPEYKVKLQITSEYEKKLKTNPPAVKPVVKVEQKISNGKVGLFINDRPQFPLVVIPGIPTYIKPAQRMGCYADFAAAGVKLQNSGYLSIPRFWVGKDKYNYSYLDQIFKQQLTAVPDAKIMVYIFSSVPEWYYKDYPEDREKYYDNTGKLRTITYRAPLASENALRDQVKMLNAMVGYIEKNYGKHVFGYLVGGGGAAEWYWPAHWEGITGYSLTTQKAFRNWLKKTYRSNGALQKAWNNAKVTFDNAVVPSPAERRKADLLCFKDPQKNRPSMDLDDFMNDMTVRTILTLCKTVKTAANFKKIVLTYNGYCMLYHGKANSKNTALRRFSKIIDSPYIDGFATPMDYDQRRAGEPGLNINPFYASAKLRNKTIWKEDDLRTHFLKSGLGRTADLKETIEIVRHCFAYSLVTGGGYWYYSLNHPALFHHEDIMRSISQINELGKSSLAKDVSSVAEVAFIVDEESSKYLAYRSDSYLIRSVWGAYLSAARMGAPFDTYLVSDLANPKMPDYKMYVFLNSYHVDKKTADIIARKVRRNNAVSVWCYAPGFFSEKGMGVTRMKELTGMDFSVELSRSRLGFDIKKNHKITRYFKSANPANTGPRFIPSAPGLAVLGNANGKAALAVKEFPQWRSVYTAVPLDKELLMGLCDYAGVHVFSRSFDVFNANKSYLLLHTTTAGKKIFDLKGKYKVKELFTGKDLGGKSASFTDDLPAKTTRIYQLTKQGVCK